MGKTGARYSELDDALHKVFFEKSDVEVKSLAGDVLNEKEKTAVLLRFIQNETFKRIGLSLECSGEQVRSYIKSAIQKLQEEAVCFGDIPVDEPEKIWEHLLILPSVLQKNLDVLQYIYPKGVVQKDCGSFFLKENCVEDMKSKMLAIQEVYKGEVAYMFEVDTLARMVWVFAPPEKRMSIFCDIQQARELKRDPRERAQTFLEFEKLKVLRAIEERVGMVKELGERMDVVMMKFKDSGKKTRYSLQSERLKNLRIIHSKRERVVELGERMDIAMRKFTEKEEAIKRAEDDLKNYFQSDDFHSVQLSLLD